MKKRLLATLLVFVLSATTFLPVSAASPSDSLKGISYYGNLSNCKMTAQQAEAFAAVIRSEEAKRKKEAEKIMKSDGYFKHSFDNQVAFVDTGNGIPSMLFFSSLNDDSWDGRSADGGYNSLWYWSNGKVVRFLPTTNWVKNGWPAEEIYLHIYSDHILASASEFAMSGQVQSLAVFQFNNGKISNSPSSTAFYLFANANIYTEYSGTIKDGAIMNYQIDGKAVSESQIESWKQKNGNGDVDDYSPSALAGYTYIRQGAYYTHGMTPTSKVLSALESYSKSMMVAGFKDILTSDWFVNDVKYVSQKNLMTGTGNNLFSPSGKTSRGQAVTILYRLAGSPPVSGDGFSDVKSSDWFYKAVQWASKNGIASGYGNGKFGPNDTLNREQLATMLYRYAQFKKMNTTTAGGLSKFSDSGSVSGYALDAMSWAVSKGLISGTSDGKLTPGATATRAQLAAILHRFGTNVK